ncbi:MAG: hypothetical protein ACOCV2_02270 [Persicimonas sp.]
MTDTSIKIDLHTPTIRASVDEQRVRAEAKSAPPRLPWHPLRNLPDLHGFWTLRTQWGEDGDSLDEVARYDMRREGVELPMYGSTGRSAEGSGPVLRVSDSGSIDRYADVSPQVDDEDGEYFFRCGHANDVGDAESDRLKRSFTPLIESGGSVLVTARPDFEAMDGEISTTSVAGQHYSFEFTGWYWLNQESNDWRVEFRIREATGDGSDAENILVVHSDPDFLTPDDHEKWITVGFAVDDTECAFFKNGEVHSVHEHGGRFIDPDTADPIQYPFCFGAHRAGRLPWNGDVSDVAVCFEPITEGTAWHWHQWATEEDT